MKFLALGICYEDGTNNSLEVNFIDPQLTSDALRKKFKYPESFKWDRIFLIRNDIESPSVVCNWELAKDFS